MKLKFKSYAFQSDAVAAVVDLFAGQEKRQDTFTITNEQQLNIDGGTGVRNVLTIMDEQFVRNMNAVQKRHNLPVTSSSRTTLSYTADESAVSARSFAPPLPTKDLF